MLRGDFLDTFDLLPTILHFLWIFRGWGLGVCPVVAMHPSLGKMCWAVFNKYAPRSEEARAATADCSGENLRLHLRRKLLYLHDI